MLGFLLGLKRLFSIIAGANDQVLMVVKPLKVPTSLVPCILVWVVCVVNIVSDGEQVVIVVHGDQDDLFDYVSI